MIRCAAAATVRHELVEHAQSTSGHGEVKRLRRRDPRRAGAVAAACRDSDGRVEEEQHLLCSIVMAYLTRRPPYLSDRNANGSSLFSIFCCP